MQKYKIIYILGAIFLLCIVVASYYFYFDLKQSYLTEIKKEKQNLIVQIEKIAEQSSTHYDKEKFENSIYALIQNTPLKGARLSYNNFQFTNDTIFAKVNTINENWQIIDITTDAKIGKITQLSDDRYQFVPVDDFNFSNPIVIKFQAITSGFIRDFTFLLPLVFEAGSVNENNMITKDRYALYYEIAQIDISQMVQKSLIRFVTILSTTLLVLGIILYLFYQKVLRSKLYDSVKKLDKYVVNLLNKNFQKPEDLQFHQEELDSLLSNITLLSNNLVQNINELNITRDIIEKKEITDDLTGLPNKKWFEKDIKHMFVTNAVGYVIYLKIDQLGELTKQHGGDTINSLIENFAKIVENFFMTNREFDGKFYRFFGAEFAIVLYIEDATTVRKILDQLIVATQELGDRYYFFDNRIFYGGVPFDKYGTIESILQSAKEEHQLAIQENKANYHVSDLSDQIEKNKELENSVKDTIERGDFALQYVYDTYDFDPTPNLIMQEVTPMIIDMRTFEKLPIGVFISAAEKIDLASEFDQQLIKKALEHIAMGEINHKIAINLAVGSFTSMRFISWLSSIMNYEKGASNLIFVITAYSAAGHFKEYKRFVDSVVEFDAQVMLKRFDVDDFSLEQLERIKPHYIRIEKDYCNEIKRDTTKQHKIKQILLFAEEHNIKVLGDSVKGELDYQTLERLGFYGTSR